MPATAPVLHYVVNENLSPAQRAKLARSHKKVEQLLGVTPSLRPVPPPTASPNSPRSHRRSHSCAVTAPKPKPHGRERGKLSNLFNLDMRTHIEEDEESEAFLHRVSTSSSTASSSSSSSSSTATSTVPEISTRSTRYPRHRPPRLNLSCSNLKQSDEEDIVLDISAKVSVMEKLNLDSPLTPLFKVDLGRQRSRTSIIEEREWNKVLRDASHLPTDHKEKSRKLNRLGKVFGVLPPLEMVYPPSPTSRSRFDPKRYTYGLPPPLLRGTLSDDLDEKAVYAPDIVISHNHPHHTEDEEKVFRVNWDTIDDEAGRKKVMDALRGL